MRINTNVASLNAQGAASQVNKNLTSSLEKLSTGLRINKAADDASGMAIADKLKIQASSLGQGIQNATSASALIQIADKAMGEQGNILDIVKTKLIQAKDSTTSSDGRQAILNDIQKLLTQLDDIASQTNYNGTTLLQQSSTSTSASTALSFQVGESSTNTISSTAATSNTANLGGGSSTLASAAGFFTMASAASQSMRNSGGTDGDYISVVDQANASGDVDIEFSGKLDAISGAGVAAAAKTTFISDNTTDMAYMQGLADTGGNISSSVAGTYVLSGSYDFGGTEFSGLRIQKNETTTSSVVKIHTVDETVTITNKDAESMRVSGTAAEAITGGNLLSTLKALGSGSLTSTIAGNYMSVVDEAVTTLNTTRSDFGSTQNQLESAIRNMGTTKTNIKAAESSIRDVDYAAESANFNKQNIIAQAGTYAMSQANSIQQNVLRLLQ